MWKVVAVILNRRLTSSITFHEVDAPVAPFPYQDEDYRLPGCLLCQVPVPKCRLDQLHDPLPVLLSLRLAFSFSPPPLSLVAVSLSLSPRLAAANHPLRSSARILDSPPVRLFCRRFTAH